MNRQTLALLVIIFAVGFVLGLANCLRTGVIPVRGGRSVVRRERPTYYWIAMAMLGLGAVVAVSAAWSMGMSAFHQFSN